MSDLELRRAAPASPLSCRMMVIQSTRNAVGLFVKELQHPRFHRIKVSGQAKFTVGMASLSFSISRAQGSKRTFTLQRAPNDPAA